MLCAQCRPFQSNIEEQHRKLFADKNGLLSERMYFERPYVRITLQRNIVERIIDLPFAVAMVRISLEYLLSMIMASWFPVEVFAMAQRCWWPQIRVFQHLGTDAAYVYVSFECQRHCIRYIPFVLCASSRFVARTQMALPITYTSFWHVSGQFQIMWDA